MTSAVDQLVSGNTSEQPVSFYDYYNAYGKDHSKNWIDADPYGIGGRLQNFFSGTRSSAEKAYQNYLSDFEFRKNQLASAKANQETWDREDSQIQRLLEDYQKAGVNPYLLLNGGNLSAGVVSSQSQKATYKRKALEESKVDNKMLNTAVKILALVLLKKAL